MVPGSFGCGWAVFAAITIFAPSFAAFNAILFPIPREAPVIKIVRPASFLCQIYINKYQYHFFQQYKIYDNIIRDINLKSTITQIIGD